MFCNRHRHVLESNERIKQASLKLAEQKGLHTLTRASVCQAIGIPCGSFKHVTGRSFSEFLQSLASEFPETDYLKPHSRFALPQLRKHFLLRTGVSLATEIGFENITGKGVAARARVSPSLIRYYFGSVGGYKKALFKFAMHSPVS